MFLRLSSYLVPTSKLISRLTHETSQRLLPKKLIDVLCVSHAAYDRVFSVATYPATNEKTTANSFIACGSDPVANATITVAHLGFQATFADYLGQDIFGQNHYQEFLDHDIQTDYIIRGKAPTPLSTIIVKPNGSRA